MHRTMDASSSHTSSIEHVPESKAFIDLLAFEKTLDEAIMQKRLDIQEALKRPIKSKRKLRVYISNTFYPSGDKVSEISKPSWELRIEGRILDDPTAKGHESLKHKMKFASFFKSIFVELDKDLYGPNNHLIEWHRNNKNCDVDGFKIKRYGDKNVRCTIIFSLNYLPKQYKLDARLARLLGIHTQTRPVIIQSLWQYIQRNNLQDPVEREFINCDGFLSSILNSSRLKFGDIPQVLQTLLHPPDPIVIHHVTSVDLADAKKQSCYDIDCYSIYGLLYGLLHGICYGNMSQGKIPTAIGLSGRDFISNGFIKSQLKVENKFGSFDNIKSPDFKNMFSFEYFRLIEIDDNLKAQMTSFLLSAASQQEITDLQRRIKEMVVTIHQHRQEREFYQEFSQNPTGFIHNWIAGEFKELIEMFDQDEKISEKERLADNYYLPSTNEAVTNYIYAKLKERRMELEQVVQTLQNTNE